MAWFCFNDCFFSIVSKDCARDELMVRARRPGDIEKVFPKAKVTEFTASDYHYRAAIKKDDIKVAMCGEIDRIAYSNFKSSVVDGPLHDSYMQVWTAMARLQPQRPYSGRGMVFPDMDFGESLDFIGKRKIVAKPKQDAQSRKNLKKLTRGQ